jgi:hypothetical protein
MEAVLLCVSKGAAPRSSPQPGRGPNPCDYLPIAKHNTLFLNFTRAKALHFHVSITRVIEIDIG